MNSAYYYEEEVYLYGLVYCYFVGGLWMLLTWTHFCISEATLPESMASAAIKTP
jgi:hypothetical protein